MSAEAPPNRALVLTMTCGGQFMVLLDSTIVSTALPDMQHRLHTDLSGLQWIVDAYVLLVAMLLMIGGIFADRFGRKRLFLIGAVVFTLSSVLCAFAPDLGWLIAGRAAEGVGAAALSPASLALLAAAYPVPRERVKAIGTWAGISGIGLAAGPLAGGLLVDAFDWRSIFLVNAPIGVALVIAAARILTESRNPHARAIDIPGAILSIAGLGLLTYGLIEGGSDGWTSATILAGFAAAVVILAAFLVVEGRVPTPMMPLRLFRSQLFSVSNTAMVSVGFSLMGSVFFFSQYFVSVQHASILDAGLETLPTSLGMAIVSPYAGRLTARYGFRIVVTVGMAVGGAGMVSLGFIHADTSYWNEWWRLAIAGVGFALGMSPLTGASIQAVSPQEGGLASGISSTARQVGAVLGVAVLGAVVTARQSHGANFGDGLDTAFLTAGIVSLVTAVFTGLWLVKATPAPAPAPAPAAPAKPVLETSAGTTD